MINHLTHCFLVSLIALHTPCAHSDATQSGAVTFVDDYRLNVEIADTPALRQRGLMHKPRLDENAGMLFVYPDQAPRGIWMKNTLLALDVLFLSDSGKVVSILRNLRPCQADPCPIFTSGAAARYMLEVGAGFVDRHQVEPGHDLMLDYRH